MAVAERCGHAELLTLGRDVLAELVAAGMPARGVLRSVVALPGLVERWLTSDVPLSATGDLALRRCWGKTRSAAFFLRRGDGGQAGKCLGEALEYAQAVRGSVLGGAGYASVPA